MLEEIILVAQSTQPSSLAPLVDDYRWKIAIICATYLVVMLTSGVVVRLLIRIPRTTSADPQEPKPRVDPHTLIGKCENVIAVTFTLLGQLDALGLVFAAKSLVRSEDIKKNSAFFLGGTLVNLAWSVLLAFACRVAVFGLSL